MPRAFADSLFRRLLTAFPPGGPYGPDALGRPPMPAPVAHFLKRLLRRRLEHEAGRLPLTSSPWFDVEHPEVRQALVGALVCHGHFPGHEWEDVLQQAVQQVTAYLSRPAATLQAFVFQDGEATVPAATINRRMGYLAGYPYLNDAVRLYLEQKKVEALDPTHFARLLQHIDRKVTDGYDTDAWVRLLKPLYSLADPEQSRIPVALLMDFFDEKSAPLIVGRLEAARDWQSAEALDAGALRRLLDTPVSDLAPVFSSSDGDGYPAAATAPPPDAPQPDDRAAEPKADGPVPLWKQFQQQNTRRPEPAPAPSAPAAEARREPPAATADSTVPRWRQFQQANAPAVEPQAPDAPPLSTLERAVLGDTGSRNRDLFVRHLFAGSAAGYERVLRRLRGAPNWPEASRIIAEEVFQKNQVNIYSNPAVLFTDAVETRYAHAG